METFIQKAFPQRQERIDGRRVKISAPAVIKYADDFVVIHRDLDVIKQCQQLIEHWLEPAGLTLNRSKTRIAHTRNAHQGQPGFNFLGVHIRQYSVGKHHRSRMGTQEIAFKVLIEPTKKNVSRHYRNLSERITKHNSHSQDTVIRVLNPIIRGWCNYYGRCVSNKNVLSKMDHLVFIRLRRWAARRHPNKSYAWRVKKYWRTMGNDHWVFATPKHPKLSSVLKKHASTPIQRYVKVNTNRSPYDGDWTYWGIRLSRCHFLGREKQRLLKQQNGVCAWCGLYFKDGDSAETDHIVPISQGGRNSFSNKQLLHRHCHDEKSALDFRKLSGRHDKPQITEEPDDRKRSRPVLKPSQAGDLLA